MIALSDLPRSLTHYIIGLWRRRWLIVTFAWVFALAGWFALSFLPDRYSSTAQIYLNTDTFLRSFIDNNATTADFEKRVRIMRLQLLSRENMELLIQDTGMDAEISTDTEIARIVQSLQENIKVENDEGQYFVISYADKDPVAAQKIVARVVNLFIEQDIGAGIIQSQEAVVKVEREISKLEQQLSDKDIAIAAFRRKHAKELSGNERTVRELDLLDAELSRIEDARYRAIRSRDEFRLLLASTPATTSGTELDALKIQLAQLQSQFNENYPDIIALKAKIAELEAGGAGLLENPEFRRLEVSLRSVESEIADLRQRGVRVRSEIDDLALVSAQQPAIQAELQEMTRSYTQVEEAYKNLLGQQSSLAITASLSEGGGTIEYNIFEEPVVAAEPSYPNRGLLTVLVAFLALGGSAGLVFIVALLDRTYTQCADLEEALGLAVLGSVSPALTPAFRRKTFADRFCLVCTGIAFCLATVGLFWFAEIRVPEAADERMAHTVAASTDGGQL